MTISPEKLSKQRFSCHADTIKMLGIWMKSQTSILRSEIDVIKHPVFTKSGRHTNKFFHKTGGGISD
jgi:hypothetical protein